MAPTYLGTRPGTQLGARLGSLGPSADKLLYALTGFSASNYYATQVGGGEAGDAAGFVPVVMLQVNALSTGAARILVGRASNLNQGWVLHLTAANALVFYCRNGADAAFVSVTGYTLTASDVGKVLVVSCHHDGTSLRMRVSRSIVSASVAITGYTPFMGAHQIGALGGLLPATGVTVIAHATFRGVFSDAQMEAYFDRTRQLGDLPTTMDGATVTHHWSAKRELSRRPLLAPAALTDNVTRAPIDAMVGVGTDRKVVTIDPARDGRRLLGAMGFSASAAGDGAAANYLRTADGAGIAGVASGFRVAAVIQPTLAGSVGSRVYVSRSTISNAGWRFNQAGQTLTFWCANGGGAAVQSASISIASMAQGRPSLVEGVHTGSALQLWVDGVQVGSDVAISGFTPHTGPMLVGIATTASAYPINAGEAVFAVSGGHGVSTAAEIQAEYQSFLSTGRIQPIPGKTDHDYDLTADYLPTESVTATVQDRIGTDHLTRAGIAVQTLEGRRGVGPYGAGDSWTTVAGGGIQGAASGFHVVADVVIATGTPNQQIAQCAATGLNAGWYLYVSAPNTIRGALAGVTFASTFTITPEMIGKRTRILFQKDATTVQLTVNGTSTPAVAAASYNAPGALPTLVGATPSLSSGPFLGTIEAVAGGNTVLTPAEIAAVFADMTTAPPAITGKTERRWILEDDVADASGQLPGRSIDRMGSGDSLVRVGSPLVLAQRTERTWSYEEQPIAYGVRPMQFNTDGFRSPVGQGEPGDNAGFWGIVPFIPLATTVSAARIFFAQLEGGAGWDVRTLGMNSSITVGFQDSTAGYGLIGTTAIAASEIGKIHVFGFCWDAPAGMFRTFARRLSIGNGVARNGFIPASNAQLALGSASYAGYSAIDVIALGGVLGRGVMSLAEYQAACDYIMAREQIVGVMGTRPTVLYDVKADVRENGGVLPATLKNRAPGKTTGHMARDGTPALHAQHARAFSW